MRLELIYLVKWFPGAPVRTRHELDSTTMKIYCLDTGLLLTQSMAGDAAADARLLRGVRYDNLGVNEGMFFENAMAQALVAGGRDLFFYSRSDRENPENTMEIDFLGIHGTLPGTLTTAAADMSPKGTPPCRHGRPGSSPTGTMESK